MVSSSPHGRSSSRSGSRATLDQLRTLKNLRDLSEACPNISPGRMYRSACPINASAEDAEKVRHRMVDLRSENERRHDRPNGEALLRDTSFMTYFRKNGTLSARVSFQEETTASRPPTTIHRCSLLDGDRQLQAMTRSRPELTTLCIPFWKLKSNHDAKILAIRDLNLRGLPFLYETILETSGMEIKKVLEILLEAAERDEPAMVFCKIGKDRTGIIAAMVLACCNASMDDIISDYTRSDGQDQVALGSVVKGTELNILNNDLFMRAPAEAMQQTIGYLNGHYGGLRGYMDIIGFDRNQQARLASALARPSPQLPLSAL